MKPLPHRPRPRLSRQEWAKLEKRVRERRRATTPGNDEPLRTERRRQRLIMVCSLAVALAGTAVWWYVEKSTSPEPVVVPAPAAPAPFLGDAARPPARLREVRARLAPLSGLASGSRLAQRTQMSWAREHALPLEAVNSIGMHFRLVPPGSYIMGSPTAERGRGPDEIEHVVRISSPFYLGKYEVTQAQWKTVMGPESNPSWFANEGEAHPVEEVTWADCQRFAGRLCEQEGLPPESYRLPHEEEWEYAGRAGTQTPFCCGASRTELTAFADFVWNNSAGTNAVGRHQPNAWGFYDMHGNVWEWCQNQFYSYTTPDSIDPLRRAIRGGNWRLHYLGCRSASRYRLPPDSHGNLLGFRLLRTVPEQPADEEPAAGP